MLDRLTRERDCYMFIQRLFGVVNLLEKLEEAIAAGDDIAVDRLMWLQFEKDKEPLEAVLSDPKTVALFKQLYPTQKYLLASGAQALSVLSSLHTVRNQILADHLRPDGKDVHRDVLPPLKRAERALLRGLTEEQQAAYEAQLDDRGFMRLSSSEKNLLKQAISAKLEGHKRVRRRPKGRQSKT